MQRIRLIYLQCYVHLWRCSWQIKWYLYRSRIGRLSYHYYSEVSRTFFLACSDFIKIKLTSCHLLLYGVYMCQNNRLIVQTRSIVTSKKWKVAPFNLAHPVPYNVTAKIVCSGSLCRCAKPLVFLKRCSSVYSHFSNSLMRFRFVEFK